MINLTDPDYTNTPVAPSRPHYGYAPTNTHAAPAVSIITPYYNTGSIFLETAQSVLQQSLQQWEWVIVNDGSTKEEALHVIEPFRAMDPRIRVVDQPNKGLAGARNTGICATSAPFVFFLDSDDLIEPTTLEQLLWKVSADPRLSFATAHMVGFSGQTYIWRKGFDTTDRFLDENMVSVMALVRRSVIEQVGMFDEAREIATEDFDFWLRCAAHGFWGADIRRPLLWYRRRPANANGDIRDQVERYQVFRQEMRQRYAELYRRGMPVPFGDPTAEVAFQPIPDTLDFENRLARPAEERRLLLILPWLNMGGADVFNLNLIEQLTQRGWRVTICTTLPSEDGWSAEYTRRTPDIFPLHTFLYRPDYPRFLRYLIRSREIDTVLISNSYLGYQLLPYLRACCPDVAFMDFTHMEEEGWRSGGYPRMSLTYAEQLDLTVVSSQHLQQWMIDHGGDSGRIQVCTTNIDTADWDPARYDRAALRQQLAIPPDMPVILYAGRLSQQKQPQLFAQVMRELSQHAPPFICLVAGEGPDRPALEQFVHREQLAQVRLLGAVSNQRMRELLALSDMFFLPSQMEGISLAIYEAMAMGVVPIGADVGGQRELVTPDCGVLVARGADEQAAYVAVLTGLIGDRAARTALGAAARVRVRELFRLEQMGERMAELIGCAHTQAAQAPHPPVSYGLGLSCATQAIEQTRLIHLAEQWWNRHSTGLADLAQKSDTTQEHSNEWWKIQATNWRIEAERSNAILAEQQLWVKALAQGKDWWEQQANNWRTEAELRGQYIEQMERRIGLVRRARSYIRRLVKPQR